MFPEMYFVPWNAGNLDRLRGVLEKHYRRLEGAMEDRGTYHPQSSRMQALRRTVLQQVEPWNNLDPFSDPTELPRSNRKASDDLPPQSQEFIKAVERFQEPGSPRAFILTKKGYIGQMWYNYRAQVDDVVCVLLGCPTPMVLRPRGDMWEVIGDVYLDGIMFGEVMKKLDEGEIGFTDFKLC
jgi:hypothetical protein